MNFDPTIPSPSSYSHSVDEVLRRRQQLLELASRHLYEGLNALIEATALAAPSMVRPPVRTAVTPVAQPTPPPATNGATVFRPPSLNGGHLPPRPASESVTPDSSAAPSPTPPPLNPFLAAAANEVPANPFSVTAPPRYGRGY